MFSAVTDKMKLKLKLFRSSRLDMFFKIGALNNFAIFTGKHLCWKLFSRSFKNSYFYGRPPVAGYELS